MTQTFRISFGSQYATRPHPVLPAAHPDRWLTITCPASRKGDEELRVRRALHDWIGAAWSMIYDEAQWAKLVAAGDVARYWPGGELSSMTIDEVRAAAVIEKARAAAVDAGTVSIVELRDRLNEMLDMGLQPNARVQRWDETTSGWAPVRSVDALLSLDGPARVRLR